MDDENCHPGLHKPISRALGLPHETASNYHGGVSVHSAVMMSCGFHQMYISGRTGL